MTPANDWITDRRPTEADGDEDGDVNVRSITEHSIPDDDDDDLPYLHWSQVSEARPWRHCWGWQPRTAPEPTNPPPPTAVTPANDWITDRRPTEADGDKDGNVVLRLVARVQWRPGSRFSQYVDWRHIGKDVPWKHTDIWQPRTAPAPEPTKPALAVGQCWRRRDGEVVTIQWVSNAFRAGRWFYNPDGTAAFFPCPRPELDLVELFPTAATPTPRKFASLSRTVTDFGHTIDAIDEDGVAWWMTVATDDSESEWHQLLPLPASEVAA